VKQSIRECAVGELLELRKVSKLNCPILQPESNLSCCVNCIPKESLSSQERSVTK
jgi:hypothetical protein